jgi:sugar-specific transcriptional regulator TrmB
MEQPEDLLNNLEQIGLTDKQARVYLALLALESSTAYEIAQHCEVKKPTVYVILEELRQKGLVLKIPHAKKALFAARDISEYLAEQRGKLNAVQSMLPRLMALGSADKPRVYYFSGMRGFTEAMSYKLDSMQGKTYYSYYGNSEGSDARVVSLFKRWTPDAVANNISFRIIMPEAQVLTPQYPELQGFADKKDHVEIKYLSEYTQQNNLSIEIAETFVRIDDSKAVTATIIDDPATAQALRSIFDIVWHKGE